MIRERNLEVNMIAYLAYYIIYIHDSYKKYLINAPYHYQVSSSYNESKEEITLDEVREKFFHLCSQNAVAVDESSNSLV